MKVCHLTSVHPPYDTRILMRECLTLSKAGHDVSLVVPTDGDAVYNGVRILGVKKRTGRLNRMFFTTFAVLQRALKENADVYHYHDPELMPAGWWLLQKGKKVIYDVHENVPRQLLQKKWLLFPKAVSRVYTLLESLLLRRVNVVTAAASNLEPYSSRFKHCVDIENYPDTAALLPFVLNDRSSNPPSAVYIGSVTFDRGIDTMLNALHEIVKSVSGFHLHLIGPCEKQTFEDIQKLPVFQAIRNNVTFHGSLPQPKAYAVSVQTRVGWCVLKPTPNYLLTYSTKMFEYMAVALPVIASDFEINKRVIEAYRCGVCIPATSAEKLANATLRMLEKSDEANAMGANGFSAAGSNFNGREESKKLLKFYDELI
jgi:glycosyltransferase involved in cell wall biosynthesis